MIPFRKTGERMLNAGATVNALFSATSSASTYSDIRKLISTVGSQPEWARKYIFTTLPHLGSLRALKLENLRPISYHKRL